MKVPNYRMIEVSFLSPTNTLGGRIKISEPKRFSNDKTTTVILSYDYRISDIGQQAYEYLVNRGFNVVGRASTVDKYIFFCDNWGSEYTELK